MIILGLQDTIHAFLIRSIALIRDILGWIYCFFTFSSKISAICDHIYILAI